METNKEIKLESEPLTYGAPQSQAHSSTLVRTGVTMTWTATSIQTPATTCWLTMEQISSFKLPDQRSQTAESFCVYSSKQAIRLITGWTTLLPSASCTDPMNLIVGFKYRDIYIYTCVCTHVYMYMYTFIYSYSSIRWYWFLLRASWSRKQAHWFLKDRRAGRMVQQCILVFRL